jgi:hypothetical protein
MAAGFLTLCAIRRVNPDDRSNVLWQNTQTGKDSIPSETWIGLTAWSIEDWFTATCATPIDFEIDDALEKLKRLNLCKQTGTDYTGLPVLRAVPLSKACERLDCVGPLFSDAFAGIGMIPSFWRP